MVGSTRTEIVLSQSNATDTTKPDFLEGALQEITTGSGFLCVPEILTETQFRRAHQSVSTARFCRTCSARSFDGFVFPELSQHAVVLCIVENILGSDCHLDDICISIARPRSIASGPHITYLFGAHRFRQAILPPPEYPPPRFAPPLPCCLMQILSPFLWPSLPQS